MSSSLYTAWHFYSSILTRASLFENGESFLTALDDKYTVPVLFNIAGCSCSGAGRFRHVSVIYLPPSPSSPPPGHQFGPTVVALLTAHPDPGADRADSCPLKNSRPKWITSALPNDKSAPLKTLPTRRALIADSYGTRTGLVRDGKWPVTSAESASAISANTPDGCVTRWNYLPRVMIAAEE